MMHLLAMWARVLQSEVLGAQLRGGLLRIIRAWV